MTDREIAEAEGGRRNTVLMWRKNHKLPPNRPTGAYPLTREQNAARMLLYQLGWGDRRIAQEQKLSRTTVREWRARRGLRPNHPPHINENRSRNTIAQLARRVRSSVGRYLAPDIVDETVATMFEAILSGELPLAEIEQAARRYGNRTLDRFASRFGARSLDEEIGQSGDGYTLLDTLVDDRSSSWLEEMGATVF